MSEDMRTGFKFESKIKDDSKTRDVDIYESIAASSFSESLDEKVSRFDSGGPMTDDGGFDSFDSFDDGGFLF